MQKISFGNVIKVNAPLATAKKVADTANSTSRSKASKQIKDLMGDLKQGKACAFSFNEYDDYSYVFSGKEAKKYEESHANYWYAMDWAYSYYHGGDFAEIDTEIAWENHTRNMENMISEKEPITEINVTLNSNGDKIKSIDVIA